jgi:uncharacterized protein
MSPLEQVLDPGAGVAFEVSEGELLKIAQIDGKQAADMLSFNRGRPRERLSMWMSCCVNRLWKLTASHVLVSHEGNDMWTIVEDTLGENYSGGGYCRPALNARWHGAPDIPSCEANFLRALEPYGLGIDDFDGDTCFTPFMKVDYTPAGEWVIGESPAGGDDYLVMRACMDQIVAISNCPAMKTRTNAGSTKPLRVTVLSS